MSLCSFKSILVLIISVAIYYIYFRKTPNVSKTTGAHNTIYEFTAKDIDGNEVSFDKYKGLALLVVNVASNCGLTDNNYNELNELYETFEGKGLRILAFPCNQFRGQEPGSEADIKKFAMKRKAKFDFFSKVEVNGHSAHPIWKWLKGQHPGILWNDIEWNFTKFLVNREGIAVKRYHPTASPAQMANDIEEVLNE